MRPASFYLALLATLTEQSAAAIGHFDTALDDHERLEARTFLAPTRYECARMLLARDDDADRERALGLLDLALSTADTLGMAAVARGIRTLQASQAEETVQVRSAASSVAEPDLYRNLFRHEREYWTIAYDGSVMRLPDAKGCAISLGCWPIPAGSSTPSTLRSPSRRQHRLRRVCQRWG
jgi:hypothetical protein